MKNRLQGFIIGVLITSILMFGSSGFAESVSKMIQVNFNSVNLKVNGQPVKVDNFLYKDTTYVPIRAAAEMLGKEVGWDGSSNTASINDKVSATPTPAPAPTPTPTPAPQYIDIIKVLDNANSYAKDYTKFNGRVYGIQDLGSRYILNVNELTTDRKIFVEVDKSKKFNVGDTLEVEAEVVGYSVGINKLGVSVVAKNINGLGNIFTYLPVSKTLTPNLTKSIGGVTITISKVEFLNNETRVFWTVDNNNYYNLGFDIYNFNSYLVYDNKQYKQQKNYGANLPDQITTISNDVKEEGIITFEPIDISSQKDLNIDLATSKFISPNDDKPFSFTLSTK